MIGRLSTQGTGGSTGLNLDVTGLLCIIGNSVARLIRQQGTEPKGAQSDDV